MGGNLQGGVFPGLPTSCFEHSSLTFVQSRATMSLMNRFKENIAPSRFLPLTTIEFEILLSLAGADRHGYAVMQEVEARSGGTLVLRPGTLYRAISRLLDGALIEELDEAPDPGLDDERRRYYRLTTLGREVAALEARRLARQVS